MNGIYESRILSFVSKVRFKQVLAVAGVGRVGGNKTTLKCHID